VWLLAAQDAVARKRVKRVVGGNEEGEEVAGGCLGIGYSVLLLCQFYFQIAI